MVLPPTSFVAVLGAVSLRSACISLTISSLVMLCHLFVFPFSSCVICFFWCQFCCLFQSLNEGAVSIFIDCELSLSFKC